MEFIRNIVLIGSDKSEVEQIKSSIEVTSQKLKVHAFTTRKQISDAFSQFDISCLYLNTNLGKADTLFILKFISLLRKEKKSDAAIFISDDDFPLAQEILSSFPNDNIMMITKPLDMIDLVHKVHFKALVKIIEASNQANVKSDLNVDLEFINVFITQTKAVLIEMSNATDLNHSPPILMSKFKGELPIVISSRIRISSDFFKGSYYIAFSKETFLNFHEKIVGEKISEINSQNKDLAGEIANIIYGKCKKKFSSEGLNLEMVIPSVHLGKIDNSVVIVIPFDCSLGQFFIAVAPGQI